MLRRVEIDNFKSCRAVVLDELTPLVALVGRNGSGKTNVLKAIETAARSASRISGDFNQFAWVQPDTRVSFEFSVGESEYRYTLAHLSAAPAAEGERELIAEMAVRDAPGPPLLERLEARAASTDAWRTLVERRDESVQLDLQPGPSMGRAVPVLPTLRTLLPSGHAAGARIQEACIFLAGVQYHALHEDDLLYRMPVYVPGWYESWRQRFERGVREGPTLARLIHLHETMRERYEELTSLLGPNGIELVEVTVEKTPSPMNPSELWWNVLFQPHGVPRQLAFGDLSAGTRRIISLLASLLLDDSSVLLVEHPEDGIHPGMVHKVIGLLHAYTEPATIFLTTHSTTVMDNLEPAECRLVSMSEGTTRLRALSARELARVHAYLKEAGPLSDFIEIAEQD